MASSEDIPLATEPLIFTAEQFAALQKQLQETQAQLAQQTSVPISVAPTSVQGNTAVTGNTSVVMEDAELQALELDWGDFDPLLLQQLKTNTALKKAFIAAHTLQNDNTQCVEGNQIATREGKRQRPSETGTARKD